MSERDLIDMAVKQFTKPTLFLDNFKLFARLRQIEEEKAEALRDLDITREQLMSDQKFADLLLERTSLSVHDLPKVQSPTDGRMKLSFAKTGRGAQALLKHPEAGPYMAARLMHKSTLEETRIRRLMSLGGSQNNTSMPAYTQLCVPLMYYGASTGRFSGRDKINLQNLGRGSVLRDAIICPQGYKIVAADLAQIEARLTAAFCGQDDLLQQFADGEDVYAKFASEHYGYEVNAEDHPTERFVGKTGILSLGYQSGFQKFWATMNDVFHVPITQEEAESVVSTYRRKYRRISNTWYELSDHINHMANGYGDRDLGPVTFSKNKVILPNNMEIMYLDLQRNTKFDFSYRDGKKRVNLYGGKLLENIIQALARIVMTTAAVRLYKHNRMAALSVHDELVFVVKEDNVDLVAAVIKSVMEAPVEWMPELPVKCEVKYGDTYGECK